MPTLPQDRGTSPLHPDRQTSESELTMPAVNKKYFAAPKNHVKTQTYTTICPHCKVDLQATGINIREEGTRISYGYLSPNGTAFVDDDEFQGYAAKMYCSHCDKELPMPPNGWEWL
jgi:hypothetical protein